MKRSIAIRPIDRHFSDVVRAVGEDSQPVTGQVVVGEDSFKVRAVHGDEDSRSVSLPILPHADELASADGIVFNAIA